jgi:hypothetical protein
MQHRANYRNDVHTDTHDVITASPLAASLNDLALHYVGQSEDGSHRI